jgi:ABC-type antimicrobial peptide transport system permease subunit
VKDGGIMAAVGIAAGVVLGFALQGLAGAYLSDLKIPGLLPAVGAGFFLLAAAVVASVLPAARAARIEVIEALRSD